MKTVYFIRHGQSTANVSLLHQQIGTTLLTDEGKRQAQEMATYMKKFPIQAIVASPFARAKATAETLSQATNISVEYSDLFVERRRPGVQLRKKKLHPHWMWVQFQLSLFSRYARYRHSDEETPEDLLARAHKALALLAQRSEETIAVVTHGRFMRVLYAAMTVGEGITGRMYLRLTRKLRMRNAALMVATYDDGAWHVHAWNIDAREV